MAKEVDRNSRSNSTHYRGYQPGSKTTVSGCGLCCRRVALFVFSNLGLCGLVIGYSVLGAFVFQHLEAPREAKKVTEVIEMRRGMVLKLWDITYQLNILYKDNWTSLVTDEIRVFESQLLQAVKDGYDGSDQLGHGQQWTFVGAFLYSLTVITTIGYGNIAPRTTLGKMITILYAVVGIPLMLLYLTSIGDILARAFKSAYSRLWTCSATPHHPQKHSPDGIYINKENYRAQHYIGNNQSSPGGNKMNSVHVGLMANEVGMPMTIGIMPNNKHNHDEEGRVPDDYQYDRPRITVPISLCLLILVAYVGVGAVAFSVFEGWDYVDGSFFCFVTLSTIGFGDLNGGAKPVKRTEEKLVLCSVYLLVGMALIAMCFNLMQEEVIYKIRGWGQVMGIVDRAQEEDEED